MDFQELTIQDVQKVFSKSRDGAYRMAKLNNWDYEFKSLDKGGRFKLYKVPTAIIPKEEVVAAEAISDAVKAEVVEYDPTIENLMPEIKIPEHELYRAQLKAELCEKVISEFHKIKVKKQAVENVLDAYNRGMLIPELFRLEDTRTARTLRMWLRTYEESGRDFKSLTRLSKASAQMKATEKEQNFLLGLLLDANRIKIGSAIRK